MFHTFIVQNVVRTFSKAEIEKYDGKILSKKLNHCIEKAYCQCNWQRICISRMPYFLVGLYSLGLQLSICTVGICNFDYRDSPAVIYGVDTEVANWPRILGWFAMTQGIVRHQAISFELSVMVSFISHTHTSLEQFALN